jgi:hypothetical protein
MRLGDPALHAPCGFAELQGMGSLPFPAGRSTLSRRWSDKHGPPS